MDHPTFRPKRVARKLAITTYLRRLLCWSGFAVKGFSQRFISQAEAHGRAGAASIKSSANDRNNDVQIGGPLELGRSGKCSRYFQQRRQDNAGKVGQEMDHNQRDQAPAPQVDESKNNTQRKDTNGACHSFVAVAEEKHER